MQQCPKMFCNFVQKVLAKNTWSDSYQLRETIDRDKLYADFREYIIQYGESYFDEFEYLDELEEVYQEKNHEMLPKTSYYTWGVFTGFSMYAKYDEVLENYKDNIRRYFNKYTTEYGRGYLYLDKCFIGEYETAFGPNDDADIYYVIKMLY